MPQFASLNDWIAHEAIAFDESSVASAAEKMLATLGESVELLGLGEAFHGGEEFLVLRNRLFQQLAAAHGFSAIALESSFTRGRLVDDFVHGRGGDSYEAVREAGFSHNFGKLGTSRELVEWMRTYNADVGHKKKLRFYGFDGPLELMYADSPRHVLGVVLDYLATLDADLAAKYRERVEQLIGDDAAWENPAAAFDPTKAIAHTPVVDALRIETENLLTELQLRRPEAASQGGPERYAEAVHYGVVARQLLNYHADMIYGTEASWSKLSGLRDASMADNLAYIVKRERGRGKVLVFAHNHHLKTGRAEMPLGPMSLKWWPVGAQLRARFGSRYAAVGLGVGTSEANGFGAPEAGTLEARLTASPGPARFIPTHGGKHLPADAVAQLPTRSTGKKNPGYFPFTSQTLADFDALLVLDTTGYARGFPPLPG